MAHKKNVKEEDFVVEEFDGFENKETSKNCDCNSKHHDCGCGKGEKCSCHENNESCECDEDEEHCSCHKAEEKEDLSEKYLNMARVIQADFDNFRKRSAESVKQAKLDGMILAVEVILPSLDIFKKAKQMITDENSLKGIEMVESEIFNKLKSLGVEKIKTIGEQFNPNLHSALSVIEDKSKQDNEILEEFQSGFMLDGKVIKYSQVIVNKIKEEK